MGKKGKAVAAGTAVVAGRGGLRRFLGGCLVVVLLAALALAGLVAVVTWMASRDGGFGGDDPGLPCPPEPVAIAYSPADTPQEVQDAVETALTDSGREPAEGGYGADSERDMVVSWWPTREPGPPETSGRSTPSLRLEQVPTADQVTEVLSDHLPACETSEPTEEPADEPEEPEEAADDSQEDENSSAPISWPWQQGWSPVIGIGLAVTVWWIAGPQMVRWAWQALWPVRLTIRRYQRWRWRREAAAGDHELPTWPEPPVPGERWHEDSEAMHDRRTHRQQIAADEPQRRAALRERVRAGRLRGEGVIPARLWRFIYRVPAPGSAEAVGASKKNGVST